MQMHEVQASRVSLFGGGSKRPAIGVVLILLLLGAGTAFAGDSPLDVSGQYSLDVVAIPIPATLVSEIQLDTPAKLTTFKFGLDSTLDLNVGFSGLSTHVNAAMSVPGIERFVFEASVPFAGILVEPEIWFAVPFETVTDINHFTNWVVIPPGETMFVAARCTTSASIGGLDISHLFMIQDVSFPDPLSDFAPLRYTTQSQSVHVGSILTISSEVAPGTTLRSVVRILADASTTRIIGWQGSGSVDEDASLCDEFAFNATIGLSGIQYCGLNLWLNLDVLPCQTVPLVLRGGGILTGMWDIDMSAALSLFPIRINGLSFTTDLCDMISASVQLSDRLRFESASVRCQAMVDTGIMSGSVFANCAFREGEGCTSASLGTRLAHGTMSGSLACSFAKQLGSLRLASFSPSLSLRLTPLTLSVSARFARSGLVQGVLSLRMVF